MNRLAQATNPFKHDLNYPPRLDFGSTVKFSSSPSIGIGSISIGALILCFFVLVFLGGDPPLVIGVWVVDFLQASLLFYSLVTYPAFD